MQLYFASSYSAQYSTWIFCSSCGCLTRGIPSKSALLCTNFPLTCVMLSSSTLIHVQFSSGILLCTVPSSGMSGGAAFYGHMNTLEGLTHYQVGSRLPSQHLERH